MMLRFVVICVCVIGALVPANAQELEGDYLYRVTTVRAAQGKLENLLDWIEETKASDYFSDSGEYPPMVIRHSQGDQWDLLKIEPMGRWTDYHSKSKTKRRANAAMKHKERLLAGAALLAFEEDHFAYGPSLAVVEQQFSENGYFHVEMFEAAPGKADELFEQRRMENAYLAATGQTTNLIFRRAGGSNVDVFTIGFHESLQTFSAPSGASAEDAEAAAIAAGFKNRADISFYLRSLISGHHDTLAVKVE